MDNPIITTLDSYEIKRGLSEKQILQLINYAATDKGLNYTSDKTRFKDEASFKEFSTHILAYYVLVDSADNLLGIIWFDDTPLVIPEKAGIQTDESGSRIKSGMTEADYGITWAIRLYREARGKGLAQEFSEQAMQDFKNSEEFKNHPHPKFWLSVSPENEPAVNLYRKLGFKDLKIDESHNKLLMILKA